MTRHDPSTPRRINHALQTDEMRREIIGLWNSGLTASQIGARYGVSRNVIIGIKERHGHKYGGDIQRAVAPPPPAKIASAPKLGRAPEVKRAPSAGSGLNFGGGFSRVRVALPGAQLPEPTPLPQASKPKTLFERGAYQCCFPVGGKGAETLFCCEPTKRAPDWQYCDDHLQLMGRAPAKLERDVVRPRRAV